MEDYPRTILEFEGSFATEEACRQYLFDLRWPDGFRCPRCGHNEAWSTSRALFRSRLCDFQTSVIAGLTGAVRDCMKPGSMIRTDGWRGYSGLIADGYLHEVVRQDSDIGDNLLPLVNRVAALLKRWIQGTHQGAVHPSHLDYYLDEFTFRFNRRTSRSRGKFFYRLGQQAAAIRPVMGREIRGGASSLNEPNILGLRE